MRNYLVALLLGLGMCTQATAQSSERLAFELAEMAVDEIYSDLKPLMFASFENIEKTSAAGGKADRTLSIFVEEMKNAFNRENLIKVIASVWKNEMTEKELNEALTFMQSPTGRKFQSVGRSMGNPKNLAPILLDACGRTKARLVNIGTSSSDLEKVCNQF